ncbi:MAG: DinB family protein [bacterium]
MNSKSYYQNLFEYENWANSQIASVFTDSVQLPVKALSVMSHIVNAQIVWLSRIKNETADVQVWKIYSADELKSLLKKSSEDIMGFINEMSEEEPEKIISYINTKGEMFESYLKDILTHLIVHSAYHRGQVAMSIRPLFENFPNTDYIHYVRIVK